MADLDRLKDLLRTEQPPHRVRKMWRAVEKASTPNVRKRQWPKRAFAVAVVGALVAVFVVAFGLMLQPDAPAVRPETADVKQPVAPRPPLDATKTVHRFSDGSWLKTVRNARLTEIENTDDRMLFRLHEGVVQFDIVPGGQKKWQVMCGNITVTVLGTLFTIDKQDDQVTVSVERGRVSVTSSTLDGGEMHLVAGESLSIRQENAADASSLPLEVSPTPSSSRDGLPSAVDDAAMVTGTQRQKKQSKRQTWRIHAEAGDYVEAFAQLGPSGVAEAAKQSESIEELFRLADVARLSGHPKEAVDPLRKILARFDRDPRAGLAAYTLGRLYLEKLGSPAEAEAAFETALTLGIPAALKESTEVKRIKTLRRQGDPRAAALAAEFLDRYPESRYRNQVETWLKDDKKSPR